MEPVEAGRRRVEKKPHSFPPLADARLEAGRGRERHGSQLSLCQHGPHAVLNLDDLALSTQKGLRVARSGTGALSFVLSCPALPGAGPYARINWC